MEANEEEEEDFQERKRVNQTKPHRDTKKKNGGGRLGALSSWVYLYRAQDIISYYNCLLL